MVDVLRLINQEQKIQAAGYEILIQNNPSFVRFLRDPLSDDLRGGILACEAGRNVFTYGAGPCVAGVALLDKPYLFHIDPTQFERPIDVIDNAQWGLIGGAVQLFGQYHQVVQTDVFIKKAERPFNVAVSNFGNNRLGVLYGQSF